MWTYRRDLERLEPESAGARRRRRHGRRDAVRKLCLQRRDRTGRRQHRASFSSLYSWLGAWLRADLRAAAGRKRDGGRIRACGVFWGALSGFMSLLVNVGAPPFQIHMLPQRLDKLTLVGTTMIFFAFMNEMKIVPYFVLGQFSRAISRRPWRCCRSPSPPIFSASGWCAKRRPSGSIGSPMCLMFLISLALLWQGWRSGNVSERSAIDFGFSPPVIRYSAACAYLLGLRKQQEEETWRRRPTTPISTAIRRIFSR